MSKSSKHDDKDHDKGTRVCPACGKDHAPESEVPITEDQQAAHHEDPA